MSPLACICYLLIPTFVLIHSFASPYTKVEESFNIQAIHDILIHGIPFENANRFFTSNYDHVSFPGSVPRSFAGALLLSGLSKPFVGFFKDTAHLQYLVRAVLGLINSIALIAFGRSVQKTFGTGAGIWYALFQSSQFHVMYYASRTLPNMYALILSNWALRSFLNASTQSWNPADASRGYRLTLYLLTIAGIVFRSELAILVATITIYLFATQKIAITNVIIPAGLGGLVIGLLCTIPLDSYFWQSYPLWPEWTAFYYNTIQGHSADWGVSPWHYYFANAIPKLLLNPTTYLFCIPIAILNVATRRRSLDLLVPLLSFVGVYSFLPHKEWRFVVYIVPGLTGVAAAGASWTWTRRGKSTVYAVLSLVMATSVLASFAISLALLGVSSLNYPGGEALEFLHHKVRYSSSSHISVHIDNLASQTGVTRFLERHEGAQTILDVLEAQDTAKQRLWTYDKTEDPNLLLDPMFWTRFDYVLAESPERIIGSWAVIHVVYGVRGVRLLKPGEKSGSRAEPLYETINRVSSDVRWTDKMASWWHSVEDRLRYPLLRGYWAELRLEPSVRILHSQKR